MSSPVPVVQQLQKQLRSVQEKVAIATSTAQQKQKLQYDKKVKVCQRDLQPGDRVLVANKTPRGRCKLRDKWEEVPYIVLKQLGDLPVYTVQQCGSQKTRYLHRNLLAICPFEIGDDEGLLPAPVEFQDREEIPLLPPPLQFQNVEIPESFHISLPPHQFRDDLPRPCREPDRHRHESSAELSGSSRRRALRMKVRCPLMSYLHLVSTGLQKRGIVSVHTESDDPHVVLVTGSTSKWLIVSIHVASIQFLSLNVPSATLLRIAMHLKVPRVWPGPLYNFT